MNIKKIGSIMEVDENGRLVNEAALENIEGKWRDVVDDTVEAYKKHLGEKLHSVYVRGSVARGTAIEGVSDVDTEVVLDVSREELNALDIEWRRGEREILNAKYPFQTGVEFVFLSKEALTFGDKFILQTQAVCVFGDDITKEWESIVFDDETIKKLIAENDIEKKLDWALEGMRVQKDVDIFTKNLVWVCKRFLRFGVLLAALREKRYTRDLYPSYELFAAQYPEKAEEMCRALELAVAPLELSLEITQYIEEFGEWLASEKRRIVGV